VGAHAVLMQHIGRICLLAFASAGAPRPAQSGLSRLFPLSPLLHLKVGKMTFEVWDLAGQANLRPSWASYYGQTNAILVVADSTDRCTWAGAGSQAGGQCARSWSAPWL
jgi:GTPase SAR1 family protein